MRPPASFRARLWLPTRQSHRFPAVVTRSLVTTRSQLNSLLDDTYRETWHNVSLTVGPPKPLQLRRADLRYLFDIGNDNLSAQAPQVEARLKQVPNDLGAWSPSLSKLLRGLSDISSSLRPQHSCFRARFFPAVVPDGERPAGPLSNQVLTINIHDVPMHQSWDSTPAEITWDSEFRSRFKGKLVIITTHEAPVNGLLYPDFTEHVSPEHQHWPLHSGNIKNFASVHPINMLHRCIFEHWERSSHANIENLYPLLMFAFELPQSNSGITRLLEVHLQVLREGFSNLSAERRIPNDILGQGRSSLTREVFERAKTGGGILKPMTHARSKVFIALGSNEGDSLDLIEKACKMLDRRAISVQRTSGLYETTPMYFEDQKNFFNAVLEARTTLDPADVLRQLKSIETDLGRVKTIENGPRPIDLDILLYDDQTLNSDVLSIPHPRIAERDFVLRPLCDLIPDVAPPKTGPLNTFRRQLLRLPSNSPPLLPQTSISPRLPPVKSTDSTKPTRMMSVLNMTPDSFSDGGLLSGMGIQAMVSRLRTHLQQKLSPSLLDVGGQSTQPRAEEVTPEEELSRVLPVIQAIRADRAFDHIAISVDTYRASVAKAAVGAGADLINDVSAGQMDPTILGAVAELGCSFILGHMRGTPETMTKLTDYPHGVIQDVATELLARVQKAERAGIRRWRIILDPGIGFAKTQAQNLEILRRLDDLRNFEGLRGFPWAVGASRKGFIGKVTGVKEPDQRQFGTAACVTAAIQGGADIVRIHDVEDMGQVVAMADAIWRT